MQQKLSKTPAKTSKNTAKTQQNARFLDVFIHARARQCMVQKLGRGGNEGGEGKEEEEEEEKEEDEEEDEEDEKDEEEEEDEAKRRGEEEERGGEGGGGGGVAWTVPCYVTLRLVGNVGMYHRFNVAMMLVAAYLASFIPRCLRALRCPRGCDGSSRW